MKKSLFLIPFILWPSFLCLAINYNGTPSNRNGGVTLTPQSLPATLASCTQVINNAGILANSFNGTGIATKNLSGFADRAGAVALQSDGKILVVGETNANFSAPGMVQSGVFGTLRYNTDGTLDTTFGPSGNGIVQTSFSGTGGVDGAFGVAVQQDGKILVVGQTNINGGVGVSGNIGIIRYNPNGSPDTTFGISGNGIVTKNISGFLDGAFSVLIQPDGKILVAGGTNTSGAGGGTGDLALLRYTATGIPDTTFGPTNTGVVTLHLSPAGRVDAAYALVLQPDGKIIVTGGTNVNDVGADVGNIVLLRYTANGLPDDTFGGDANGIVQMNISGFIDAGTGVALQSDGSIVVVGGINTIAAAAGGVGSGSLVVLRYNSTGILDTSFGANNLGYVTLHLSGTGQIDEAFGVVLQADGKILVVGGTNYANGARVGPAPTVGNILVIRYNSNGSYDTTFGPNGTGIVQLNISGQADNATAVGLQANGTIIVTGFTNYFSGAGGDLAVGDFFTACYSNPFTLSSFTASYGGIGLL